LNRRQIPEALLDVDRTNSKGGSLLIHARKAIPRKGDIKRMLRRTAIMARPAARFASRAVLERTARRALVVMDDLGAHHVLELAPTDDQDPVEAQLRSVCVRV
jgi:hypothetical protein